ncbi:MAG: efflux RND transporter periplasmic adaptor subunit [Planctomycetota bacterium]
MPPDLSKGWCGGHGVPESVCTRCNSDLIPQFKTAGDWCEEHGLPESQCTRCRPEVAARWRALAPREPGSPDTAAPDLPATHRADQKTPSDEEARTADEGAWCPEHGVPEAVCTRCNPGLIAKFKAAGDWCAEHGLPESQCAKCHPEVTKKWAARRRQAQQRGDTVGTATQTAALPAETARLATRSVLAIENDPFCPVDQTPVRLRDASIAARAGIAAEPATRRRMAASIEAPGEIDFDRTRLARITPRVPGVVREMMVRLGDDVQVGDLLAVVESPALGEAKSRYIELRENLALAEADRDRTQVIYDGAQAMLAACTPEATAEQVRQAVADVRVGEAKSTLLKAHAELEYARIDRAREQRLVESRAGTQRSVEAAQATLAAAEAQFHASREATAFSVERDRLAAQRAAQVARSALDAAERRLHLLGVTEDQVRALGKEGHPELSRYELRSPVAGRIVKQQVAAGEAVDETEPLFEIADLATMWLTMDVHERDLPVLRIGLPVLFMLDGVGQSVRGAVTWIAPVVDDRTRTLKVRADLPNEDGTLRARMFGRARIALHGNDAVLTVPAAAVQTDGCCQLVFVRQSEDVYQPRKVVLGTRANGQVEVVKGLADGEAVVTAGSFLLKTEILKSNIGAGCCEVEMGR